MSVHVHYLQTCEEEAHFSLALERGLRPAYPSLLTQSPYTEGLGAQDFGYRDPHEELRRKARHVKMKGGDMKGTRALRGAVLRVAVSTERRAREAAVRLPRQAEPENVVSVTR